MRHLHLNRGNVAACAGMHSTSRCTLFTPAAVTHKDPGSSSSTALRWAHMHARMLQGVALGRALPLPRLLPSPDWSTTIIGTQVACVLLNDSVPFRVHWPKNADLRVNNVRFNTGRRNIMHALGPNGRDEPVSIGSAATAGMAFKWLMRVQICSNF